MFSHRQVWSAIDALAALHNMSVSRLAKSAGLDPTTFNKSKRQSTDGRLRWPSTESLSKIMAATETDLEGFTALLDKQTARINPAPPRVMPLDQMPPVHAMPPSIPLLGMAEAGTGGYFDDGGFPAGQGWDEVHFPRPDGESVYALEISGDSMMPLYRDGDTIIVSPSETVRRGDRVVVKTLEGEVMAKVLARKTAKTLELESVNKAHQNRTFDVSEVEWIARIVWASQ